MRKTIDIVSKALSILLYPLFVPTYGVALFCVAFSRQVIPLPFVWSLTAVIGTFLLTCALPLSAIWIMMRRGEVTDMQINNASERTIPYLYSVMGFAFWCYLMISILQVPLSIRFVAIGATLAIGTVAVINKWWKISAHLTGLGGLFGGVMSYCMGIGVIPSWTALIIWFALCVVLMYARVNLKAHTPAQVCAGWLLGISFTFLPYCMYLYVA